jgi:glycosyltransferase involved in cell wall biosynthesis
MSRANLVCLLPVRNGEQDLPGYFESVARFADAIVALDDGSTDRTRQLLDECPLVRTVIDTPRRTTYEGWDDAGNRNRLLEAAAALEPTWILSLDADERIPADDALALREFVDHEALPGCAYGFQVFRMWQDIEHFETEGLWVYRLFAFEPGQEFPGQRLHFVPIPTSIPRELWLRTTVRIQHLGSVTESRRQARFEKYRQADPGNEFQHSYQDLLSLPHDVGAWQPRRPNLPVLDPGVEATAAAMDDAQQPRIDEIDEHPAISAVVISRNDEDRIARSVSAIVRQDCPWPFEVIVVTSGTDRTAAIVQEQFPGVKVITIDHPALPGEARNAGLRVARGEFVTFPGSHVELTPGSLAARLRAHDLGYAMVTGSTINGTRTWAGWASYFLDHSAMLPGRASAEYEGAPPHCSYRRSALLAIGGFPEDMRAGEDTVVNNELARRGYTTYWDRDVQFIHHSPCRTPWRLLAHHFVRGRGFGRILRDQGHARGRPFVGRSMVRLYQRQVRRRYDLVSGNVGRWNDDPALAREYRRARPLVFAGALAAYAGNCYELLRPLREDEPVHPNPRADNADVQLAPSGNNHQGMAEQDPGDAPLSPAANGGHRPVLPSSRIVGYYGHPHSDRMGILGEHDMHTLLSRLQDQARSYQEADPHRPVLPAFELIAVMAQRDPGPEGLHRARLSAAVLDAWADFTERHGVLLILDVQPGRSSVPVEIGILERWLARPHVHLAIDPEWTLSSRQQPGIEVGSMDAGVITEAQQALATFVKVQSLPPKLLIVHQFKASMIRGKALLRPVPGVQLVINMDGFGNPRHKTEAYSVLVSQEPVEFAGVKLFYQQDDPLMTPREVLNLTPAPDIVTYQ